MELRLEKGMFEFLLSGFFLGILFAFSIMLKWYGEPVTIEAIMLILTLAGLFALCFIIGKRATKGRKLVVPIGY